LIEFLSKYYIVIIIGFCALLYSSFGFKKDTSRSIRIITIYLICYFLSEFAMRLHAAYGIRNHYVSHFYFLPQFVLLSLFYKTLFTKFQKKIVNTILITILSILTIQYITFPKLLVELNTLEVLLTNSAIIFYAILHLYNSLTEKGKFMYINAGILLYISCSTLIFFLFRLVNFKELEINSDPIILVNRLLMIGYISLYIIEYKQTLWKSIK